MIAVLLPAPALDVIHVVDAVTPGGIHRPTQVLRSAGGKGLNLARALGTFGRPAVTYTALGGHAGALVSDLATAEGLSVAAVPARGETRLCLTVAPADGPLTEFYEPAAVGAAEVAAAVDLLAAAPDDDWTVVSGSFPADADLEHVADVLSRRRRVALDTHGRALEELVSRLHPALVKINRAEAADLLGVDLSAAQAAGALVRDGRTDAAVVSDGVRGAVGVNPSGMWRVSSTAAPGRFPVGSGDSFLGGLLAGLADGDLPDALARAAAAGAANAAAPGAGRFSVPDVQWALAETVVDRLA